MEHMTPAAILERATTIAEVRSNAVVTKDGVREALVAARQIRAWVDGHEAWLVRSLAEVDSFPEATIAETSGGSLANASKTKERADTLGSLPSLAGALEDGTVTAGHIDVVTRAGKQLDAKQRQQLFDTVDHLTGVAAAATVEQFNNRVRLEVKQLQFDDGESRLARQKRNTRLSTWTDDDGMWNLRGVFDPETGIRLWSVLDATITTAFAEATPEHCPEDPMEKQRFLGAHALARLIGGCAPARQPGAGAGRTSVGPSTPVDERLPSDNARNVVVGMGRPSVVVVIDADAPNHEGPVAQWGIPVELPVRVVAELAGTADVTTVVVRNGVVVHAPGVLDLGRSTRLANRAQRRALRGLYRCCAVPGCSVGFDRCKIHHIVWWRHGGRTDIDNLLPVCSTHHSNIHDHGWQVELGPSRQLVLRLPDGAIRNTGPPSIRAS